MKISYYLNEGRIKNLYCRISDGNQRVTFSLGHTVNPDNWNEKNEEVVYEDDYFYTLMDFRKHLHERYHTLKSEKKLNVLNILKEESAALVSGSGIQGIARNMFDATNKIYSLPKYDEFIIAFEKFSNLKASEYRVQTVGYVIHFITEDLNYEIDTYEGKTAFLKSVIDERSYEEVYTMTNENIWSLIYTDAGIEKHVFLPEMLREWEIYWDTEHTKFIERGKGAANLDKRKELSWKQFQVFMECYENHGDIISLANEIDDFQLYPIAVITMMKIFNPEVCYSEYCEFEFSEDEWESVWLNEDDDNSPVFYIREIDL